MSRQVFDVVVIGGGPAGSVTALYCVRAGYSVGLVERQAFPRETLCGEFLSHEVIAILSDIGLLQEFLSLGPSSISRLTLCLESGFSHSTQIGFPAFGMKRSRFDNMLLEAARTNGVSVIQPMIAEKVTRHGENFEIICRSQGGSSTIQSRWVIGAYGKRSSLDRQMSRSYTSSRSGLNGVKFHISSSCLADIRPDEILLCAGPGMYCGINHVDNGSATVCFLERRKGHAMAPRERIRHLASANSVFAKVMTPGALSAVEAAPVYGAGNIYFGPRNIVENGMLMVGDAARVIAPLAGNGIGMAMQGAQLLGRILEDELRRSEGSRALEYRYRRIWEQQFAARVRAALVFQQFLLSNQLQRVGSALLSIAPSLLSTALTMTRARHIMQEPL